MVKNLLPDDLEDAYPLSGLQAGMLFHSAYSPETDAAIFHDIFGFYLKADFDLLALQAAVQQLAARHPVLRTSFDLGDFSQPVQLVHSKVEIPIQVEDLRHLSPGEQDVALKVWMQAEKGHSFDWTQPPLLHFQIHRRTDETFQFTVSFHHAILDGWSVASMLTELFQIYFSQLGQDVPPLKPPPVVAFRDFIALERQAIESEEQRRFWAEKLRGCTVVTVPRWPTARPGDDLRQILPYEVSLPVKLSEHLNRVAHSAGVPIKSVLLAAHLWVLSRLSGQSDVLTGVVSHGRPEQPDGERVLGLFLNTLPFRLTLSGGTWMDLVQETYRTEREMLPFRLFPLPELQSMHGGQTLFETGFNFIHFHVYQGLGEFAEVQLLGGEFYEATNFTLGIVARQDLFSSQINLILEYDSSVLCEEQIKAIGGYYARALDAIANAPQEPYTAYSLLSEQERRQMLEEWNATQEAYEAERCMHQVFEEWAARQPDAVAVIYQDQHLSYDALNRRANQLAHYLRARGLGPEGLAGIYMRRSLETMEAILGVLKAGGAYVPLDVTYPQERLAFMLADTRPLVLLTQAGVGGELATEGVQRVCLEEERERIAEQEEENPSSGVGEDNLAYVIYTSGSTGQPKGVLVPHRGLPNVAQAMVKAFDLEPGERVLQFSSLSFDASVYDLLLAMGSGGALCLARESLLPDEELGRWLGEVGVSVVPLTASALAALPDEALNSLRVVISGAEACPAELVARWSQGQRRFFNVYGPTEATIWATVAECARGGQKPSIGRPIANVQVYVLDRHLQPVAVGVGGELCIGGVGVTRGYLNSAGLTATKFVPHPFSREGGERLYRTGDLVRYLPDGRIDFLGRIDHQVKVRGFRIESGEIETALREHPAVQDTVVVARPRWVAPGEDSVEGSSRLVAYIVSAEGQSPTVSELRRFLQVKLPEYMVPAAFVPLETLPMSPNGKVDRRALPEPDATRPKLEKVFVAPRTSTEKKLAEIWAQVLKLECVGVQDNFLELGGDSILSLQIATRANQAGLQITPRQLFENQTVAELAQVVGTTSAVQAEQGLVIGPVPLTPIQHWFFGQRLPDPHHFNQPVFLQVSRSLEPVGVEQAFQHLLRHHDALRLRFVRQVSGWQQINAEIGETPVLTQIDMSMLPRATQAFALEITATELQASLNLAEGPLLRAALFDLGPRQESRLLIVVHHLVVDGVSWRVLLEDLQAAYEQLRRGETVQLAPKTTSFKQWAEQSVIYAQSETLKQELDYWLTGFQACPLPVDYPRHTHDNVRALARTVSVRLGVDETRALLQNVPTAYHTQINEVLLTALAQALSRWVGERSVLIDLEGHGREEVFEAVDVSRTVGWFTAVFPMQLTLPDSDDLEDVLISIKEQLRSIPNRGIGYGLLRYLCGEIDATRKLCDLPQAEIAFNYLGQWDQAFDEASLFKPADESAGPAYSLRGSRRYLLELNGFIAGGQLQMDWMYGERIHRRDTIERVAQDFIDSLQSLITHCQSIEFGGYTPSDFPDVELSEEKFEKVLAELSMDSLEV